MMNYITKKYYLQAGILIVMIVSIWACTSMDEGYKEFLKNGETSYTGKIDSLKVFSGKNRVKVKGLFISDPKITECRIYWNTGADSISVPVTRTENVDTLDVIIDGLPENIYSFEVRTLDAEGNKSVAVSEIGIVYGNRYQNSLYNRPEISSYTSATDPNHELTIEFASMDVSLGPLATEIKYTDIDDVEQNVVVPIDSSSVVLENYNYLNPYISRTLFLPEPTSLDVFYSDFQTGDPVVKYLGNNAVPFKNSSRCCNSTGVWGILDSPWITNDAAKNHYDGTDYYGGWASSDSGSFNLSSLSGGTPITNGKVYQTITLPAGTYKFKCTPKGLNGGLYSTYSIPDDFVYLVAAKGNILPDSEAGVLETDPSTLGFVRFDKSMSPDVFETTFTINNIETVSLGISATQGSNKFCPILSFSLEKM